MIAPNIPVSTLERRHEFSGLLRENQQFATGSGKGIGESVNGWFDRLMIQSGIQTTPMVWLGLCVLSAAAFGGMTLILTDRGLPAAFTAFRDARRWRRRVRRRCCDHLRTRRPGSGIDHVQ